MWSEGLSRILASVSIRALRDLPDRGLDRVHLCSINLSGLSLGELTPASFVRVRLDATVMGKGKPSSENAVAAGPEAVTTLNYFEGSYKDENARIWPFKVMRGKQPYDAGNKLFGVPHLFGKDSDAYWKSFNWNNALKAGIQQRGLEFSGDLGFIETEYYWPVTHMVAPGEDARERGFTGAAGTDDGKKITEFNRQADPFDGLDAAVIAFQIFDPQHKLLILVYIGLKT